VQVLVSHSYCVIRAARRKVVYSQTNHSTDSLRLRSCCEEMHAQIQQAGRIAQAWAFPAKEHLTIMNTNIEALLRDFLAKNILFVEKADALADDASFLAEGIVDSIGLMELAEYVRHQFGFELPLGDVVPANFDSIARLSTYIRRRLAEQADINTIVCPGASTMAESMALPTELARPSNNLSAGAV